MQYKNILITGGAGFVGSNLAVKLKDKYPDVCVVSLDNLKRRGSELNLPRIKEIGVTFIHGDIRNPEDLEELSETDLIIECSAEPSVLAGINSSPAYMINTNLIGSINCLEYARKKRAAFMFVSTSRVYPIEPLNNLNYVEEKTRFTLLKEQSTNGASTKGISETFPLDGARSLYGTTKLASELLLQEYIYHYGLKGVINRCGVITGPWQMGKVDQGVFVLWVARHIFGGELSYIGYGGKGKQVRDFIHIDDLFDIIDIQLNDLDRYSGDIFNIGGGVDNSLSLIELTKLCEQVTGKKIKISSEKNTRPADLKSFIMDCSKITQLTGWRPRRSAQKTISDIAQWIQKNKSSLKPILS